MIRGSNPGGGRLGRTQGLPSSTTITESFSGVKRPGRGFDHLRSSCAEDKERVEFFHCGPPRHVPVLDYLWSFVGRNLHFVTKGMCLLSATQHQWRIQEFCSGGGGG